MRNEKIIHVYLIMSVLALCLLSPNYFFPEDGVAERGNSITTSTDTIIWDTNQTLSTDYIIPQNKTLVIKPGITINFSGVTRIVVYGALSAIGNNITFININGQVTVQDGFCNVSFCNISFIECTGSTIWISNSTVKNRLYSRTSNIFLQNAKIRGVYGFSSKIEISDCNLFWSKDDYALSSFLHAELYISDTHLTVINSTIVGGVEVDHCIFNINAAEVLIYNSTVGVGSKELLFLVKYHSRLVVANTTINGSTECLEESVVVFRQCNISGDLTIYKSSNAYFYNTQIDRNRIFVEDYYSSVFVDEIQIQKERNVAYYLLEYGYYVLAFYVFSLLFFILFMESIMKKRTADAAINLRKRYYAPLFAWVAMIPSILSLLLSYICSSMQLDVYTFVKVCIMIAMPLAFSICGCLFSFFSFKIYARGMSKASLMLGIISLVVWFLLFVYIRATTIVT